MNSQAPPTVWILLSTFGRPMLCERAVRSAITAITHTPELTFAVIAGVNGSDSETKEKLQNIERELGQYTPIFIYSWNDRKTPAASRNRLLEHVPAEVEWVYFLDDDAYLPEDFFRHWLRCELTKGCVAVGGPNLNPPGASSFQKCASHALASSFATYLSSARYRAGREPSLCSEESLILCNLFVQRAKLMTGAFWGNLICAEENWLLQNLEDQGDRLGYDPSLRVWHERRPSYMGFLKQVFKYGFGRGQIFKKRPQRLKGPHLVPAACVLYSLSVAGLWIVRGSVAPILFAPFILYLILCIGFAAKNYEEPLSFRERTVTTMLFPSIHVSYAFGLIWGWLQGEVSSP